MWKCENVEMWKCGKKRQPVGKALENMELWSSLPCNLYPYNLHPVTCNL